MKRQLFAAASLLLMINATAQTPWLLPGNSGTDPADDFVGTTDNEELVFRTDDLFRFRLNKTETYGSLGAFTSIPANGFGLLSPSSSFIGNGPGPFSLFHLADGTGGNAQPWGYRPWMRVGLTVTGNDDQGYLGHKYTFEDPLDHESGEVEDFTDMVIQWSDNPGKYLKDRMRFIFTSAYNASNTGAGSLEGLEAIRLWPKDNDEVNIGLGDFYAGNIADPSNVLEPTERLDVLTGKVRIRQLPTDAVSTSTEYVTVNTTTGVLEHRPLPPAATPGCEWFRVGGTSKFVLSGTDTPSGGSCPDRAWLYGIGTASPSGKLTVVHNANERATDAGIRVNYTAGNGTGSVFGMHSTIGGGTSSATVANGIGHLSELYRPTQSGTGVLGRVRANEPSATMTSLGGLTGVAGDVDISAGSSAWSYGAKGSVILNGGTGNHVHGGHFVSSVFNPSGGVSNSKGVFAESVVSNGSVTNSYGLHAVARNASGSGNTTTSYGVYADSYSSSTLGTSHGLYARGAGGAVVNYGVKAYAHGLAGSVNYGIHAGSYWNVNNVDWAGYFSGSVYSPHGTWQPSDEALKSNVDLLSTSSAAEVLSNVQLHTYQYNREQFPHMNLPEGEQVGVLAQELEAILPGSVRIAVEPAVYDEDGGVQHEAVEFKAVNYGSLIPYLVAAYQDERRNRESLESRLDHLEQALAACCANPDGSRMQAPKNTTEPALDDRGDDRKLRIVPNPFNESTTVYYNLERGGRTQLMATSADGRELRVLQEANLSAGDYQFQWNTASLAPGMYYVTLLLDGQPVVKKGVKVAR